MDTEPLCGVDPAGIGDSVNDDECEGAEFFNADTTRANTDSCCFCCSGTCACECGVRTNGVTCCAGCVFGISASFACTERGDGGDTRIAGFGGGVGGYECTVESPVKVTSESRDIRDPEPELATEVRR